MTAWLLRLVGGWIPIGTKPISEWLGKLLWALGIVVLVITIYHKLFYAHPVTNIIAQPGSTINTGQQDKRVPMFGCSAWRINTDIYFKK